MEEVDGWLEFEDDNHKQRYQRELELEEELADYDSDQDIEEEEMGKSTRRKSSASRKKTIPRKQILLQKLLGRTEDEDSDKENASENQVNMGIHLLPDLFSKEQKKTKRIWGCPGNEHKDVADMIWMYARWFRSVIPSLNFDAAIDFAENNSFTTEVKDELRKGRDKYAPLDEKDERSTVGTSSNTETKKKTKKRRVVRNRRSTANLVRGKNDAESNPSSDEEEQQEEKQNKSSSEEEDEKQEEQPEEEQTTAAPPRKKRRLQKKQNSSDEEEDE
jgi:hypothetical protein